MIRISQSERIVETVSYLPRYLRFVCGTAPKLPIDKIYRLAVSSATHLAAGWYREAKRPNPVSSSWT